VDCSGHRDRPVLDLVSGIYRAAAASRL
jgi:hypothetical protein